MARRQTSPPIRLTHHGSALRLFRAAVRCSLGANSSRGGDMGEFEHKFVNTNGIKMHLHEAGSGFPVVMCHGFPEMWYSWRHQIRALAAAGFRAIAPDQRGYGETDCPRPIEAYTQRQLVADIVGMLDALKIDQCVIVGHDW